MALSETDPEQLRELSAHLSSRRAAILEAARTAARDDPEQTTVHSLNRAQFYDHLPQVLDAFELMLRSRPGGMRSNAAEHRKQLEEVKHGLHRWQQGYRLRELLHEWGHLHHCLFDEIESFARDRPHLARETLAEAHRQLIRLVNDAISESAGKYAQLQQDEASGHLRDLQSALASVREVEQQRSGLIRQVVHDLRGNVQTVTSVVDVLREPQISEADRSSFFLLLQQNADALAAMMQDLMDLARLEAGKEHRDIEDLDAAMLIREFGQRVLPMAKERGLYLRLDGPASLAVRGDGAKIRRIVQNLVLNALKYTTAGGVTVNWGAEGTWTWWIRIKDTGPGMLTGPGAPMVENLHDATASARESEEQSGTTSRVLPLPADDLPHGQRPPHQQSGEGIGLSIVKRLCDLLDASLELASSPQEGTTFRIVLPRRYE